MSERRTVPTGDNSASHGQSDEDAIQVVQADDERPPTGWARSTIAEVGSVRLGLQRSPKRQIGGLSWRYLRTANITAEGLDLTDVSEMDITPQERRVFGLRTGDIVLIESSGSHKSLGRAAVWADEIPGCCFQNHVIRFRPHSTMPEWALIVFGHLAATGIFARTAQGIGLQHLGLARFSQLPFPLPPLLEQQRIVEVFRPRKRELDSAKAALETALVHITEQDREILAAAVTGELVEREASLAAIEQRAFEDAQSSLDRMKSAMGRPARSLFNTIDSIPGRAAGTPEGWTWARVDEVGAVRLGKMLRHSPHEGDNQQPYLPRR